MMRETILHFLSHLLMQKLNIKMGKVIEDVLVKDVTLLFFFLSKGEFQLKLDHLPNRRALTTTCPDHVVLTGPTLEPSGA